MELIRLTERDLFLTEGQLKLCEELDMDPPIRPTAGQTREQARRFAVASFCYACMLEDEAPSGEAVEAELDRRGIPVLDPPTAEPRIPTEEERKLFPPHWDFEHFGMPTVYRMALRDEE